MKRLLPALPIAVLGLLSANVSSAAPAGAPAGATAICKDGSYFTGATRSGACRGHKGIQDWFGDAPDAKGTKADAKADAKAAKAEAKAAKAEAKSDAKVVKGKEVAAAAAAAPAAAAVVAPKPVAPAAPSPSAAAPAPAPVASAPAASASRSVTAAAPVQKPASTAPAGGPNSVWVNESTKVYHCPNTRWYGKTKQGVYMNENEAVAKGYKADHGKACGS
jgi:hypothetical protein